VRKPQRDARQGGSADVAPTPGGGVDVRELSQADVGFVDSRLPLSRLDNAQTYLIAWEADDAVGHAHVAWKGTTLGVPEIQDVYVRPERRGRGIATTLSHTAERLAQSRGHEQISISASVENERALRLYRLLGYRDADLEPQRVQGTIVIRGRPIEIDDTLVYLIKDLA
jgi:ribosomal protein S18 acetylase RimI-like enzyme